MLKVSRPPPPAYVLLKGLFEPRSDSGSEHFTCQDSDFSQIFKLIVSADEKIRKCGGVKEVKKKNCSLPVVVRDSKTSLVKAPSSLKEGDGNNI